jgi:hypothetical protein
MPSPKSDISIEDLLMFRVIQREGITGLLIETGIFTKEEFLEMRKRVNPKMKKIEK